MGVDDHVGGLGIKSKGVWIVAEHAFDEPFEKKTAPGDLVSVWQAQLAIVFDEHRVAGWLKEKDGRVLRVPHEQGEVLLAEFRGFVEISLAESGAPATFAAHGQNDFETGGFEDFHGSDAN